MVHVKVSKTSPLALTFVALLVSFSGIDEMMESQKKVASDLEFRNCNLAETLLRSDYNCSLAITSQFISFGIRSVSSHALSLIFSSPPSLNSTFYTPLSLYFTRSSLRSFLSFPPIHPSISHNRFITISNVFPRIPRTEIR